MFFAMVGPRRATPEIDWGGTIGMWVAVIIGLIFVAGIVAGLIAAFRASEEHAAKAQAEGDAMRARGAAEAAAQRQARWDYLCQRFGEVNASLIWQGKIHTGLTEEMVREMLGPPEDFTEQVLKTKTKCTYKYHRIGANRYATHIYFDDGVVVGWKM